MSAPPSADTPLLIWQLSELPVEDGDKILKDLAAIDPMKVLLLAEVGFKTRNQNLMALFNFTNVTLDLRTQWENNDNWDPIPYMTLAALLPHIKGRWTFSRHPLHDSIEEITLDTNQPETILLTRFVTDMLNEDRSRIDEKDGTWHLTPLQSAAEKGTVAIINLLLDYGALPNITTFPFGTALLFASRKGHLGAVRVLLQRGAIFSINIEFLNGTTALTEASEFGYTEIVKELLRHGANPRINEDDIYYPRTPLYNAAKNGHLEVVKLLLGHGANANGGGQPRIQTPLEVARENEHEAVATVLERALRIRNTGDTAAYDAFMRELRDTGTEGMFRSSMVI